MRLCKIAILCTHIDRPNEHVSIFEFHYHKATEQSESPAYVVKHLVAHIRRYTRLHSEKQSTRERFVPDLAFVGAQHQVAEFRIKRSRSLLPLNAA